MTVAPPRYHESLRLKDYDYTQAGPYFVTTCTHNRRLLFGEVVGDRCILNRAGAVVVEEWIKTAQLRSYVTLDEFMVMPNHLHAIIFLKPHSLAARGSSPQRRSDWERHDVAGSGSSPGRRSQSGPRAQSLGAVLAAFKGASARRINIARGTPGAPVWQEDFYERIIRNEGELAAVRQYTFDNPRKWDLGKHNPEVFQASVGDPPVAATSR